MNVAIAPGGIGDIDGVMGVMARAFDPRFGEAWSAAQCLGMIALPGASLLIARAPGFAGFALARTIADSCELMLLAVDPALRANGIGRQLLDQVAATARALGAKSLFLEVRAGNSAVTLYCSAGLVKVGARRDYYRGADGTMFDAETFRRDLN